MAALPAALRLGGLSPVAETQRQRWRDHRWRKTTAEFSAVRDPSTCLGSGPVLRCNLAVDGKRDGQWLVFEKQLQLESVEDRQGLKIVVFADNYCGYGEHTSIIQAGNLVLEIPRDHVGNFAQSICQIGAPCVRSHSKHFRSHQLY